MCQCNKDRQIKASGLLNLLGNPSGRWVDISMDFLVSLPKTSDGNEAIMISVNRLTKRAIFIETKTAASAVNTAYLFMKQYEKCHGLTRTIISHRDLKFSSKIWTSVTSILKTQNNL